MLAPYVLLLTCNSEESCVTANFWATKFSQLLMCPLHVSVQVAFVSEGFLTHWADISRFVTHNFQLLISVAAASVIIVYNHLIPHLDIFLSSTKATVTLLLVDNLLQSSAHPLIYLFSFHLGSSSSSQGNQLVDTVQPHNIVTILVLQSAKLL